MVDFSLLQQPNFAQAALAGYQAGQAMGALRRRQEALAAYQQTGDTTALDRSGDVDLMQVALKVRQGQREDAKALALGRVFAPPQADAPSVGNPPPPAPQRQDGIAINWQALREYAALDPDGALKLAQFSVSADRAKIDQAQKHGEFKARVAYTLRQIPEGPQRQAAFQQMLPQLQAQGFDPADLAQARLDDASLDRDIAFGQTLENMLARDERKRQFEAQQANIQADNARADAALAIQREKLAEIRRRAASPGAAGDNADLSYLLED